MLITVMDDDGCNENTYNVDVAEIPEGFLDRLDLLLESEGFEQCSGCDAWFPRKEMTKIHENVSVCKDCK